jgi:hypothetical protein
MHRGAHAHRSIPREERFGHLERGVGADAAQPGDFGGDGHRRIHLRTVPLRPMHADEVIARGRGVPERRVLAVIDERQPAFGQRVLAQRRERDLADRGDLRATGAHDPTVLAHS